MTYGQPTCTRKNTIKHETTTNSTPLNALNIIVSGGMNGNQYDPWRTNHNIDLLNMGRLNDRDELHRDDQRQPRRSRVHDYKKAASVGIM